MVISLKKKNEPKVEEIPITFEEVVEILIDLIDDGHDIVIFGANGNSVRFYMSN